MLIPTPRADAKFIGNGWCIGHCLYVGTQWVRIIFLFLSVGCIHESNTSFFVSYKLVGASPTLSHSEDIGLSPPQEVSVLVSSLS